MKPKKISFEIYSVSEGIKMTGIVRVKVKSVYEDRQTVHLNHVYGKQAYSFKSASYYSILLIKKKCLQTSAFEKNVVGQSTHLHCNN